MQRRVQIPPKDKFLLGAATAAFQVEGGLDELSDYGLYAQIHSEVRKHDPEQKQSEFVEAAGKACNQYELFREDIERMANQGYQSYRFGIEWARIEPQKGRIDHSAVEHYRDVIKTCREFGIVPIPTLHHFTSPKWVVQQGGWASEQTPALFGRFAGLVAKEYGDLITGQREGEKPGYICTINEVNTGALNETHHGYPGTRVQKEGWQKVCEVLQVAPSNFVPFQFASSITAIKTIIGAHVSAVRAIHAVNPELRAGLTMASQDIVPNDPSNPIDVQEAGRQMFLREDQFWNILKNYDRASQGDFIGVQSYTHLRVGLKEDGSPGILPPPPNARLVKMGYEFAPYALANCVRHTAEVMPDVPLLLTEYGIGTDKDPERVEYYQSGIADIVDCINEGIKIDGLLVWSDVDNFEWEFGYGPRFGLTHVDYATQDRTPKGSARFIGGLAQSREYSLPRHLDTQLVTRGNEVEFGGLGG